MQGNIPTGGLLIHAISPGNSWTIWKQGGEGAFTIIPNFLLTGILSMLIGLTIIIWSVGFIHRRYGSLVLLVLCATLFLVGGGVAQVALFIIVLPASSRINHPLGWWKKTLSARFRAAIAKAWQATLAAFVLLFFAALELAVIGFVPGVQDPQTILHITWSLLGLAIVLVLFSIVTGFAFDLQRPDCPNAM